MKRLLTLLFILIQTTDFAQVELLKFDAINLCDSVEVVKSKVRLNLHSIDYYKDSLRLKVRLIENCGLYHKQGAIISRNDTLILMWTDNNNEIDKNLHDFKLDLGISYLENEPILGVEKIPLYKETYFLISKKKNLKNKKKLKWQEIGNLDLCLISKENQFRRILDAVFKENNINPRVLIESNSMTHIYSHVNSSEFSTIMPYIFTQSFNYDENTNFIQLISPEISHKVGIVHIDDNRPSPIKNNFLKFLKSN